MAAYHRYFFYLAIEGEETNGILGHIISKTIFGDIHGGSWHNAFIHNNKGVTIEYQTYRSN